MAIGSEVGGRHARFAGLIAADHEHVSLRGNSRLDRPLRAVHSYPQKGQAIVDRTVQGRAGASVNAADRESGARRSWGLRPELQGALDELGHDVRHSVGTILTLVTAGRHRVDNGSDVSQFLDAIEFEAYSIGALCRNVLVGSADDGPFRVDEVVRLVVEAARHRFGSTIEMALEPAAVTGDQVALARMLRNLIDNACHAAESTGRVRVRVGELAGTVWIEVCDSGPGFGKAPSPGGLGLAIIQSAVQGLQGVLTITNGGTLGGTTITVTIPTEKRARLSLDANSADATQ